MKTITEFAGMYLKLVNAKLDEWKASSKPEEEIPAALTESFKAEGDKLKFLQQSIKYFQAKPDRLKRVLVMTVGENEKAPPGAEKIEEHFYVCEFFPEPPKPQHQGRPGRGDRDRGGKRGKGGRGKGRGGDNRQPRRPKAAQPAGPYVKPVVVLKSGLPAPTAPAAVSEDSTNKT